MDLMLPDALDELPDGQVVALSGHRPGHRAGGRHGRYGDGSWSWVRAVLPELLERTAPLMLWSGGALGFDQIGGYLAVAHGTPLGLVEPFDGFDDGWGSLGRRQLEWLRSRAAQREVVCAPGPAAWKYHARNERLLDVADLVVALWDGHPGGGTAATVGRASDRGIPVVHLDPHRRTVELLRDAAGRP